jgi:hypothetical protein
MNGFEISKDRCVNGYLLICDSTAWKARCGMQLLGYGV